MKAPVIIVFALIVGSLAQRGSYAGRRPIGFPVIQTPEPAPPASDDLGNRFGENIPTTTIRLPVEALGDADLVNRLRKLPVDQQPFWLLNWEALEANREKPQTYQQRPNSFIANN